MDTQISLISSMATREILSELLPAFPLAGKTVRHEATGGVDAAERLLAGEVTDVVVLAADAIERLCRAGRVERESSRRFACSGVAIAVAAEAAPLAIDSEEALRGAVLAARRIGLSTGPSGTALQRLFAGWGLADVLRDRVSVAKAGTPVATLLAAGEVDLGFQQLSELLYAPGIRVLGPMPPGLKIDTQFIAALCTASPQPEAARALIDFLCSPAAQGRIRRHGMQP